MKRKRETKLVPRGGLAAPVVVRSEWPNAFRGSSRAAIASILPAALRERRWFGGKARQIEHAEIVEAVPIPLGRSIVFLVHVRFDYARGAPETYALPVGFATGARAGRLRGAEPQRVLAALRVRGVAGVLYAADGDRALARTLLEAIGRRRVYRGPSGDLVGVPGRDFRQLRGGEPLEPAVLGGEQSNTSIVFGDRLILKLFRRVEPGMNPDVEIGRFLSERAAFRHVPAVAGVLEYRPRGGEATSVAILQQRVANQGDAWRFTFPEVDRFLERARTLSEGARPATPPSLLERARSAVPMAARESIGPYLGEARLLGRRTAELHTALASEPEDPGFAPEVFTPSNQKALYRSLCSLAKKNLALLRARLAVQPPELRPQAIDLLAREGELLGRFHAIVEQGLTARRTRVHGDYHLGQVLRSAGDWMIIDFEGEPALPLVRRRLKSSPLRDVAGMVRSFHYASQQGIHALERSGEREALAPWADYWYSWVSAAFLAGYLEAAGGASFMPRDERELELLLTVYLLEKAVYELGYELNNRPEWVHLPLAGIRQLLDETH